MISELKFAIQTQIEAIDVPTYEHVIENVAICLLHEIVLDGKHIEKVITVYSDI